MLLYVFATFCVSLVSGYSVIDDDYLILENIPEILSWPDSYTVKATKISLTSNLIEDIVAWKSNTTSRVDYNDGNVKSIVDLSVNEDGKEIVNKYQIHPETSDGETSFTACTYISNSDDDISTELDTILPRISDSYEAVGNETIIEKETVKFVYIDVNPETEARQTIWAYYEEINDEESAWVPVRYEKKEYNVILGEMTSHEIWDFFSFDIDFDDDVFDIDEYDCTETITLNQVDDSQKITKDLMFMNLENKRHVDHMFRRYMIQFEREYAYEQEHVMRKAIFHKNLRLVAAVNKMNLGYKLAINQFSDRTTQELERSRGLKKRPLGKSGNIAFPYNDDKTKDIASELPDEFDLRLLGLVSPVKNQEDCGSCWTYGTTSAVEGALARVNGGRLMSLSNQALVDCVWSYGASGCDGGSDNAAYEWMMDFGLPTEEEYGPYKNKDGVCHIANMTKIYPIRGYTDVTPFSNEATKVALIQYGPLSVSVDVTSQFSQYSSGIFYQSNCDPLELNHEVTLVGYGVRDGDLFWILKNSWGPTWGIDGYMLISAKDNACGVTTEPTYVVF